MARQRAGVVVAWVIWLGIGGGPWYPAAAGQELPDISVRILDAGSSSSVPLSPEALCQMAGRSPVPEDRAEHQFRGDAVLLNGRLAVVLRQGGPGAEVYGCALNRPALRTVLAPAAPGRVRLRAVRIVKNSPGGGVEAEFRSAGAAPLRLRYGLTPGQPFVQTEARGDVTALQVASACRFVVLPDFFADDMVIDATEIPDASGEVPSENFLLQLVPGGEAVVMSVTLSRDRDARIGLAGRGPQRIVERTEIPYGREKKVWVAVIEGPGIWHQHDVRKEDAGSAVPLSWTMPYPAVWRVDWSREDGLTGSWAMALKRGDGSFDRPDVVHSQTLPPNRRRWTTVLGWFEYPCWVEGDGRGHLQPLREKAVCFQGPALIYPIGRVRTTPLTEFTVVDIVRATLGVGPCEYILDVEGQGATLRGRPTCATRDLLNGIYQRNEQRQTRDEIERALDDVLRFVTHIRGRIETYRRFGQELLAYLDQQREIHPELAEFIGRMERLAKRIETNVDRRKDKIHTPAYVAALTDRFRRTLLDYEADDALEKCKAITRAIVIVGGNQDELVGECRMAVKNLRQAAGLAVARDPRTAEIAGEIRRRTQRVLRHPATYEAPRH